MNGRLERLRRRLEEPLLVSNPVSVRYLTGFASSNAALLVEPERTLLFTDFRYRESARLVFGVELVPRTDLVETLREVKDEAELELVRRAADIADEAFERLARERFVGRTERDLAWAMETFLHELGASGPSFEIIVASGPNAALPHARPTERVVEAGETVIVDAGCVVDGYCSDCTRTFATGELPAELARAYSVCLRAQGAGLAAVVPGADGKAVDAVARAVIDGEGLGDRFGHGLGHGVGLEVHERPWLNPEFESTLAAGNVVTVEPGIYLPGLGGVRIEDLVVVGVDGPEVLSSFTKELVTLG